MIDFDELDEHTLVVDLARGFASRMLRPHQREHEHDGVTGSVRAAACAAGLDGLWSLAAPMRCGALEELAFGDAGATLAIVGPGLATAVAARLGADTRVDALHVDEDTVPDAIAWLPVRGVGARATVVQCDRRGQWRVVLVGVEPIATLGLQAAGGARCSVIDRLAGGESSAARLAVGEARLAIAAICVGVARASLEYAAAYVQERRTFGKRLADHQAVAFMIAEMAMATAAARHLVRRAAIGIEAGDAAGAAHAFVEATSAAMSVTDRGVQLLGGHGYLKDHPVEKWMRDARALGLLAGGRDAAAEDSEHDAWERRWT